MILAATPGLGGALAVLDGGGELVEVFDLPVIGDGAGRCIDAAALADRIRAHTPYAFAIVEQARALPGTGVSNEFKYGSS